MMRRIVFLSFRVVCLACLVAWSAMAHTVYLKRTIVLKQAVLRLGDVFEGVGDQKERVVVRAPHPGHAFILTSTWLNRLAERYDVPWRAQPGDKARVTREGWRLSSTEAVDLLKPSLMKILHRRLPSITSVEVKLETQDLLFSGERHPLYVSHVEYSGGSHTFSALLGSDSQTLNVRGYVYSLQSVVVPVHMVRRGALITKDDVTTLLVRRGTSFAEPARQEEQVVGKTAKRRLMSQKMILLRDVEPPVLVHKNSLVFVVLQEKGMVLSIKGRALQSGHLHDVVQVKNIASGVMLLGTVTGAETISVLTPHQAPQVGEHV